MECNKINPLLSLYIMGDLDERDVELVESHVAVCGRCRDEIKSYQELKGELLSDHIPDPGEDFWRRFEASIMEATERVEKRKSTSIVGLVRVVFSALHEVRLAPALVYAASIVAVSVLGTLFVWKAHIRFSQPYEEILSFQAPVEDATVYDVLYADYFDGMTGDELELVSEAVTGWKVEVSESAHDILPESKGEVAYEIYSEIDYMGYEELDLLREAIEKWECCS
jgi:hypothetical protein